MQLDAVDCGAVMGRAIQGLTLGDDFHWSFRADPGLIDKQVVYIVKAVVYVNMRVLNLELHHGPSRT